MRTVTAPTLAAISGSVTRPGWFAELQFSSLTVRSCSFGTTIWNSLTWTGANFTVSGMAGDGRRATLSFWDSDAALRTLALTDDGIRNRRVTIWKAQADALADDDPNVVFYGVGDAVKWAKGRLEIQCARLNSRVLMAPRKRISPATGFNFLAPPGTVIQWGDVVLTLRSARG